MGQQFIIKLGNTGPEIGRLDDNEKIAPVILDLIRRGLGVNYSQGGEVEALPQLSAPSGAAPSANGLRNKPFALDALVELRTPEQKHRGRALGRPRGKKADHIAGAPKWQEGDTGYLAWSMLDDDQRLRLSSHRMTRGEVVAKRPGHNSVGVRFNGDPEPVWLKPIHLAHAPEAE
jgi:hypothetical protein